MSEARVNIAVVVLAAGEASRMGEPKQLLEVNGRPLIRFVAENVLQSGCGPVTVVIGAHAGKVRAALDGCRVNIVENPRWAEGMGTSIQAGVRSVEEAGADAVILMLADQPLIDATVLKRLAELHRTSGKPIVAADYAGTVGVPVLFARECFPLLLGLAADQGCKGVILKNRAIAATMPCPEAEVDIDTPEDYRRIIATTSMARC